MDRTHILARICAHTQKWDIIVIGGGATGVGCALDAAVRGYQVLLLEQHDFGKGTSSRSTKLVHGGVRYLEQGNITLVRQALRERSILLRNAPHVVRRQSFIVPCYSPWQKFYYGMGLKFYDLLAGRQSLGASQTLSRTETVRRLPTIRREDLCGGVLYHDAQFDDTRLLIDMISASHRHGAATLNYAKVSSLLKDEAGKISGVRFEDIISGESLSATAKVVINATGVFSDSVRTMSDDKAAPMLILSRGIHLVVDASFLASGDALMIPKTSDRRVLFCIPWLGSTLIGTTETPIESAVLEPQAIEREIEFVLHTVANYLDPKLTRGDIRSVFAGIRPLVKTGDRKNTAELSRGHTIEIDPAGLLTITGGKWTTYREMAEDAIDRAAVLAGLAFRPSVTRSLAIDPAHSTGSDELLDPRLPYMRSDVVRAARSEMAQTVEDVLARRTRSLFLNAQAAIEIAPEVGAILAEELKKDIGWIETQICEFNAMAKQYLGQYVEREAPESYSVDATSSP